MAFHEDFNSYSDGDLNGQNGGTGWSGAWSGSGNYDVQGSVVFEGAKAVINSANANADIERHATTGIGSGAVYIGIRPGNTSAGAIAVKLQNASSYTRRIGIVFNSSGNIVLEGTSNVTLVSGYAANTFYLFRITFDTGTNQATAAYSTAPYGSAESFSSESSAVTMANSGDIQGVYITKDARSGNDYVDYISTTNPYTTTTEHTKTLEPLVLELRPEVSIENAPELILRLRLQRRQVHRVELRDGLRELRSRRQLGR